MIYRRAIYLTLLFAFFCLSALAQEWKAHYDQAIQAYQKQEYTIALSSAEVAYTKSTDIKNKAYTVQLITAVCLETEQVDKGARLIEEEIQLFEQIEGNTSKSYVEALKKQVTLLEMSNQLKPALQKVSALIPIIEKVYGATQYEYYAALLRQSNINIMLENYAVAKEPLNKCLTEFSKNTETAEDYFTALFLSALVDKKLNDVVSSEKKIREYISIADTNNLQGIPEYAQAKTLLSQIILGKNKQGGATAEVLSDNAVSSHQRAQYLFNIAQGFQQESKLDSALRYYSLCEKVIRESSLETNTAFSTFINLATVLILTKNFSEAEKKISMAKVLASKLYSEKSTEFGYLYKEEGDLFLARGQVSLAEEKYILACDLTKAIPIQAQAQLIKNITKKLLNTNSLQTALKIIAPLANQALAIQALNEQEQLDIANLYGSLLIYNQDKNTESYLTQQIASVKNAQGKGSLQVLLASHWQALGEGQRAAKLLKEVINRQPINTKVYSDAVYQLARVQQRLGQFKEAELNYTVAIKSYKISPQLFHDELSHTYNSLATFYITLGNYAAAEQLYNTLIKETDPNSSFYSALRQNLAAIYEQTLRYPEAQTLLEETLKRDKTILGTSHPDYAITLQNLAVVYQKTGALAKAKDAFIQALEIDKNNFGEQNLSYAAKLANLGAVHQELNELDNAKTCYETALKIRESKIGRDHPDYVFNQYMLAVLYQRQKQHDNAYKLFKDVSAFYLNQINELFPALSEVEKTAFYNKISEVINAYQDFAIDYRNANKDITAELYNFRLATKALLLNASTKIRSRIMNSGDTVLLSRFNEWQHIKEALAKLYTLNLEEKSRQRESIEALKQKANTLEKYLSSQSELFASNYEKQNATWQQVKSALKPGEAAIEMIRLKLNQKNDSVIYAALIIKPEFTTPSIVILPNGKKLEGREFNNYRNCIHFEVENRRSHSIYWQPIQAILADTRTVYFSPDGVYNKINIATLLDAGTYQYLIDQINIRLVSNTKEILNAPKKLVPNKQATLLGFPNYAMGGVNANLSGSSAPVEHLRAFDAPGSQDGIPELPGTKEELLKINALLKNAQWQVKLFMQDQATEEAVKSQHSPTVIHIATHGFFIESKNNTSPVVFSNDISETENNPLLRSGLLLAGAEMNFTQSVMKKNKTGEKDDGILTALEAMNLNLDNTDLVILSACETGAGQIRNGEGVFGLQRSFLVSGAGSVMMSLWKVDDNATQELMVEFYKNWLESNNKADAFQKTQLALKKKYTEPQYWGSFIMMGI
jgi:CHAT domain-containing protein